MSSTRNTLSRIDEHLNESMGVRLHDSKPQLSPVADSRDVGRRALRTFGTLDLERIIADPDQPRVEFDADELQMLARSLIEKGQFHPIRVRWSEENSAWVIISGERRYRAARLAGLKTIQCSFHDEPLPENEILEQQLIENLLRSDLRPLEQAKAFLHLMEVNQWNGKQLAQALRITTSMVTRTLSLLKLPKEIQEKVEQNELSATAAYELSKLGDTKIQESIFRSPSVENTVQAINKHVRKRRGKKAPKQPRVHLKFPMEEGWLVTVSNPRNGTYHEVEQTLEFVLEEVRHRIKNNAKLF